MIENMAGLVRDKVIDGITDIRDESNNPFEEAVERLLIVRSK